MEVYFLEIHAPLQLTQITWDEDTLRLNVPELTINVLQIISICMKIFLQCKCITDDNNLID